MVSCSPRSPGPHSRPVLCTVTGGPLSGEPCCNGPPLAFPANGPACTDAGPQPTFRTHPVCRSRGCGNNVIAFPQCPYWYTCTVGTAARGRSFCGDGPPPRRPCADVLWHCDYFLLKIIWSIKLLVDREIRARGRLRLVDRYGCGRKSARKILFFDLCFNFLLHEVSDLSQLVFVNFYRR